MQFLTSLDAMELPDQIEEVNAPILMKIVQEQPFVSVLFCEFLSIPSNALIRKGIRDGMRKKRGSSHRLIHLAQVQTKSRARRKVSLPLKYSISPSHTKISMTQYLHLLLRQGNNLHLRCLTTHDYTFIRFQCTAECWDDNGLRKSSAMTLSCLTFYQEVRDAAIITLEGTNKSRRRKE